MTPKKPGKRKVKKQTSPQAKPKVRPKAKPTGMEAMTIAAAPATGPCKISTALQISASAMPVTINLCKDNKGTPADPSVQLVSVDVFDASTGNPVAGQPTSLQTSSFVLKLPAGTYDINSTIGPGPGAKPGVKPTVFLFESCKNATTQLCAFIAGGPNCGFTLTVN